MATITIITILYIIGFKYIYTVRKEEDTDYASTTLWLLAYLVSPYIVLLRIGFVLRKL